MSEFPSFSRLNNIPLYYIPYFVHSSLHRHLACFYLLANVNNAPMSMRVQICVPVPFSSFECIPRSRTGESFSDSMINFSRNSHSIFHNDYSLSHTHQQCTGFQFLLSSPTLVIFCFLNISHPQMYEVVPHYGFDLHFSYD